jgi:pyruvate dehydrogenase E2 component (dihydrolipoamide acetyltransferase)
MTVEFKLPELGENITAGDVVRILVNVGDTVVPNQPVLELETDKATIEVPVSVGGVVKNINLKEGDKAAVGQVVLTLESAGQPQPAATPAKPEPPAVSAPEPKPQPAPVPVSETPAGLPPADHPPLEPAMAPAADRSQVAAAPNLRRLAREIGVDIAHVPGTGPQGRISMADVKQVARQQSVGAAGAGRPAQPPLPDFARWGEVRREPMSNVRRATAEHLSHAWAAVPHVTQFDQANIDELESLRKHFAAKAEQAGAKLTITAILLKVVAAALKTFPQFNASIDMARREVIYKDYYHVGVAVDTERGLLVPVVREVDRKNIFELAAELADLAEKARNRKLAPDDMQGGNFSITNLGGIGGTNFTPIVNWPEAAILGVARSRVEPVYHQGQFVPRQMLPLALSYDHRLIDGADAARFLRWVVNALENPVLMSLQAW